VKIANLITDVFYILSRVTQTEGKQAVRQSDHFVLRIDVISRPRVDTFGQKLVIDSFDTGERRPEEFSMPSLVVTRV